MRASFLLLSLLFPAASVYASFDTSSLLVFGDALQLHTGKSLGNCMLLATLYFTLSVLGLVYFPSEARVVKKTPSVKRNSSFGK